MEDKKRERFIALKEQLLLSEIINYVKTQKGIDNVRQIVENAEHEQEEQCSWQRVITKIN